MNFLETTFWGSTAKQWIFCAAFWLGTYFITKIILWFFDKVIHRICCNTETKLDDIVCETLRGPLSFGFVLLGVWLGLQQLTFESGLSDFLGKVYTFLVTINVTWFVSRLLTGIVTTYVDPIMSTKENKVGKQVVSMLKSVIHVVIWAFGVVMALNNIGYDVGALIAGLGLGGLMVAMAAKDTVSNFFGGVTIFIDKPFTIDDRVRAEGFDGFVTKIGMRSFCIKTLDGTEVVIPNSKVIDGVVENVSREPARKVILDLGLTYDTKPEQMQRAMDILREISAQNTNLDNTNTIVSFTTFGDFSLGIKFIYYIKSGADIFGTQNDVNMSILSRFNAEGLNFAFPTQTIYVEKNN